MERQSVASSKAEPRGRLKNVSPRRRFSPNIPASDGGAVAAANMKAKIVITPKKAVVDPQGKTVQSALAHLGYNEVAAVHVGKYLEIELTGADKNLARQQLDQACHKFLSNPIIEDYRLEIE
jgi:phosphoribosylformylglycinamidine synthase PurS subunit